LFGLDDLITKLLKGDVHVQAQAWYSVHRGLCVYRPKAYNERRDRLKACELVHALWTILTTG